MPPNLRDELSTLLDRALSLQGRGHKLDAESPLAGSIPELDSIGVVAVVSALEEHFDIVVDDEELDSAVFRTFGTLLDFVARKLGS